MTCLMIPWAAFVVLVVCIQLSRQARKERNRLALLETDFATGEEVEKAEEIPDMKRVILALHIWEADPWDPEGSDVELFSSSFVRSTFFQPSI